MPAHNKLIAALPVDEYREVRPHLRTVPLLTQQVLHKRGDAVRDVYFPGGGTCSLLQALDAGNGSEIAAIGDEGVIGANVFFGEAVAAGDAVVSIGGVDAYAMDVRAFNDAMAYRGGFHNLVVRYSQAVIGQVMQLTICDRLHPADARACRWLITTHDRIGQDAFPLSYGLFASIIGVPQKTLVQIVAALARDGAIDYVRGHIRITNLAVLQHGTCECYALVTRMFGRLLPELTRTRSV